LYEENPTGTSCYIYGPTGLCAKKTATQGEVHTFYYHTDHLGSTRLVTDESAAIVFHAEYEPFGESAATGPESYLYTGKEKDVTDLYYYGARYYDPEIGRFITKDPLAGEKINPQSLNSYTYCLNNPVKLIDPEGLFYKMCLENGSCLWIWEGTGHWSAKDAAGSTITDSAEIDSFLAQGMILEAVVKILQIFGFNVSEDDIHYCKSYKEILDYEGLRNIPIGYIQFDHNGTTIKWDIYIYFGASGKFSGKSSLGEDGSILVVLSISNHSSAGALFHVVGHESIHVNQYLSGQWALWVTWYGLTGAEALAEMDAYAFNVQWSCLVSSDTLLVNEFRSRYAEHAGLAGYYTTFRDTRFRNPFPT
jgi:RHS repeat-associated protein